jgi:hypothetical protein
VPVAVYVCVRPTPPGPAPLNRFTLPRPLTWLSMRPLDLPSSPPAPRGLFSLPPAGRPRSRWDLLRPSPPAGRLPPAFRWPSTQSSLFEPG